jgi:mycothiol S-conjugate amidase
VTTACLLTIHAHPDDESSKGPGTIARYAAQGVRTVLVTCTGGEAGDILNPAADSEEARTDLGAVRRRELDEAVGIIGYERLHWLGYRDSGMPGTETNEHPESFHQADFDEAVGRLVEIVREERPQVLVAYGPSDPGRGHPDHIRTYEIGVAAYERAGDPAWYPEAGEPWTPSKLYYVGVFSKPRLEAMHGWLTEHGHESPWADFITRMGDTPDKTTTRIDISDHLDIGRKALLAHRTQIDPEGHWFRVPIEVMRELHPYEDYELALSRVPTSWPEGGYESDLFAGVDLSS